MFVVPRLPRAVRLRSRISLKRRTASNVEPISPEPPGQEDKADQASPASKKDAHLSDLNISLAVLCDIFPDVRPEVFRELLLSFSDESRLYLVTEVLLRDKPKSVRGRWQLCQQQPKRPEHNADEATVAVPGGQIPVSERFRSSEYKNAVKAVLYEEFKGLSHSTIKAVLAERNHSYSDARPVLIAIRAKSWKSVIVNIFTRFTFARQQDHPLVSWQPRDDGLLHPHLKPIPNFELRQELEATVLQPLVDAQMQDQAGRAQHALATSSDTDAQSSDGQYECACCCISYPFEEITTCLENGHYLCETCIQATMNEALYGQGWSQNVDFERCTLKCLAVADKGEHSCNSCLAPSLVRRAVESQQNGRQVWSKFEETFVDEALRKSSLTVAKCPFCLYAEATTPPSQNGPVTRRYAVDWDWFFIIATSTIILATTWIPAVKAYSPALSSIWAWISLGLTIICLGQGFGIERRIHVARAKKDTYHPLQGRKFICRNPSCGKVSCSRCSAMWYDPHACNSSPQKSLEMFVESAISNAVKRTCPVCSLSFIKSTGCNKLVCNCGYKMCYICRADICSTSYDHFCPHFRPLGGACKDCNKCNLYKTIDEEKVIKQAKAKAQKDWVENEGKGFSDDTLKELGLGHIVDQRERATKRKQRAR